jgi:hypothetical protein
MTKDMAIGIVIGRSMADHSGTSAATAKLAEILNVGAADSVVVQSERDRLLNELYRTFMRN